MYLTQTLSLVDLDLLVVLAGHDRLQLSPACRMLDILGQACLLNPFYSKAASVPFLKILSRFSEEKSVFDYTENLAKIALSFLLKEPMKWRNALIVELLSKIGALHLKVSLAVKHAVVEASITYLQTFKGVVLHPSLRSILEVWPNELKKLQDTFYNLTEDVRTDADDAIAPSRVTTFTFNPGLFSS